MRNLVAAALALVFLPRAPGAPHHRQQPAPGAKLFADGAYLGPPGPSDTVTAIEGNCGPGEADPPG